jgi:hypothetical protein
MLPERLDEAAAVVVLSLPVTGGALFSEEVFSARAGGGASQLELSVLTLVRITHFLHLQINCPRAAFSPQVV